MPLSRSSLFSAVLAAALLLLGGCDLFTDNDTTIRASGTVVLAETGAPLEGITVALDEIVGISHVYVETVETDAEGRFALSYDAKESFGYNIIVNANNTTLNYTGRTFRVNPGDDRSLGVIELSRIED